ncbi:Dbl homology domain-containing protein [Absidia repens]|uniref:Dbl homology domain-containing protein n=1 Tax=Absidia repens TaxID=90262 RepID=A0A1X2IJ90_9FUNG|nr:Dbl homology domain-containing protein [Absidia repens]
MPPLTHSCFDIVEAREWAGSTMDSLFSNEQPSKMDPALHITLGHEQHRHQQQQQYQKQLSQQSDQSQPQQQQDDHESTIHPRRASVLPHRLQRLNKIRRSFSVLDNGIYQHKKSTASSLKQNEHTQLDNEPNQYCINASPPYSPCSDDSSTSTITTNTTPILTSVTIGTQSAPVSPTDIPRRPSFSSRILRKTFDMKSLLITTFDRQRKDSQEKEREALALWQHTFEQSLLESGSDSNSSTPPLSLSSTLSTTNTTLTNNMAISLSSTRKYNNCKSSKYSRFIMMELLSTEETYLEDLYIIKTKFMDPLVKASQQPQPIINNRDIRTIFAFVPQLLLLSATLVRHLRSAIDRSNQTFAGPAFCGAGGDDAYSDDDEQDPCNIVGHVMYDLESSFDVYIYYTLNFRKSRKCLNKVDCDALCHQLLQDSSIWRKETKRMNLSDFLITPIQRITRYCLILKDLQKHSPQSTLLDRSIKCLSSLAFAMNEIQ